MSDCEHSWLYKPQLGPNPSHHFCYKCQLVRPIVIKPKKEQPPKCKGKERFDSWKAADRAAIVIFNRAGHLLRVYPHKDHYHLTSDIGGRVQTRIFQSRRAELFRS